MGQSDGRTYCAVAKYRLDADDAEKRRDLKQGLSELIYELAALGMSLDDIRDEVATAIDDVEYDQTWNSDAE